MHSKTPRILAIAAMVAMAVVCLAGCSSNQPRPQASDVFYFEVQDRAVTEEFLAIMKAQNAYGEDTYVSVSIKDTDAIEDPDIYRILTEQNGVISSPKDLSKVLEFFSKGGYDIEVRIKVAGEEEDEEESTTDAYEPVYYDVVDME